MGVKEIFAAVGLAGSPLYFAAITYGFFYWLDRKASVQASRTISRWLKGQSYRRIEVQSAIVSAFDSLYSTPLLKFKAFTRSAIVSSIVLFLCNWYIVFWFISLGGHYEVIELFVPTRSDMSYFVLIILSDYLALFVIRKCLLFTLGRPFTSLLLAIVVGGCFVTAAIISVAEISSLFQDRITDPNLYRIINAHPLGFLFLIAAPTFFVHLWLPLFALGAFLIKALYMFFDAARLAQWFFKEGSQHPTRAIGTVAAVCVFAVTAIVRVRTLFG